MHHVSDWNPWTWFFVIPRYRSWDQMILGLQIGQVTGVIKWDLMVISGGKSPSEKKYLIISMLGNPYKRWCLFTKTKKVIE